MEPSLEREACVPARERPDFFRLQQRLTVVINLLRLTAQQLERRDESVSRLRERISGLEDSLREVERSATGAAHRRALDWSLGCLCATALSLGVAWHARGATAAAPPAKPGAAPDLTLTSVEARPTEEELSALGLVHGYVPPGWDEPVGMVLDRGAGWLGPSPWSVERMGSDRYLVTFRPVGSDLALAYEFEADLSAGTVVPAPDTERLLAAFISSRNAIAGAAR